MKKVMLGAFVLSSVLCGSLAANNGGEIYNPKAEDNKLVIKMELLGEKKNIPIGEIIAVETDYGVAFYPDLSKLESGIHGFHIHENPDCGATEKGLGMKAGGHWDPDKTGNHSFPWNDDGHKGDLPAIYVDRGGKATYPVLAPKIKTLDDIKERSIMIHIGGDNHHDKPAALGGGGARMACGVIK